MVVMVTMLLMTVLMMLLIGNKEVSRSDVKVASKHQMKRIMMMIRVMIRLMMV